MSTVKSADLTIEGGQTALPDGTLVDAAITIADGRIVAIGGSGGRAGTVWNAGGMMVLPGVVDLHGDAFERQIMPRPGVTFPLDMALVDTDRQMTANGITTAYHGVTYSWEPGLRSRDVVVGMLEAMEAGQDRFGCDTRFHMRFETFNLEAVEEVAGWLASGRIDLLAFNNHMPAIGRKITDGLPLGRFVERTGLSQEAYVALAHSLLDREGEVSKWVEHLAAIARDKNIPMASHDDETAEMRRAYHELGCSIAEFPLTPEAADESARLGDMVILGAPNVVRGGSHLGPSGISAATEIAEGRGDILCSDYYYPALVQAPFALVAQGIADFPTAWRMISTNPARAAKLDDRGEIAIGQRADLVILSKPEAGPATVAATLVAGQPVYRSGLI